MSFCYLAIISKKLCRAEMFELNLTDLSKLKLDMIKLNKLEKQLY